MPCSDCGAVKPEAGFHPNVWRKSNRRGICKACLNARSRTHYHTSGEKEQMEAARQRRLAVVNAIKAERGCRDCNESRAICLDFHHRNPSEKRRGIGTLVACSVKIEVIIAEIAKCDVICANCHRVLHWQERNEQKDERVEAPLLRLAQ